MLTRTSYDVYLTPTDGAEPLVHRVEITHGDHLRGEFEANKQSLPSVKEAPMNHTTVWVWCALVRTGLYTLDYRTFKDTVLGLEPVRDAAGELETPVDPTEPVAGTGSP